MADIPQEKVAAPVVNTEAPAPAAPEAPAPEAPKTDSLKTEGNKVDTLIPSDPYYIDPLFYEVANYFGLEQEDYASAKNKLSDVVDFVIKDKQSNKVEDVLTALRELEDKVGPPAWGERRYTKLYQYVRLLGHRKAAEQAIKAFERGVNE